MPSISAASKRGQCGSGTNHRISLVNSQSAKMDNDGNSQKDVLTNSFARYLVNQLIDVPQPRGPKASLLKDR